MQASWTKLYPKEVPAQIDESGATSLGDMLEDACVRFGARPALTCLGASMSYGELAKVADEFAAFLQSHCRLQRGERVAIVLPNLATFAVCFFAAQKIGAVCVNTNPLYTPRELEHQLADSGAKTVVILDLFLDKLAAMKAKTNVQTVVTVSIADLLPWPKRQVIGLGLAVNALKSRFKGTRSTPIEAVRAKVFSFAEALEVGRTMGPPSRHQIKPDEIALLQYTGGTTGVAKGAMLTHRNVLANVAQIRAVASPYVTEGSEMVLTALPLYHIFALTANFLSMLATGQHLVLVPRPVPIPATVKMFKKHPITVVMGVNTLFNAMVSDGEFQRIAPRLKYAIAGGMALQESTSAAWEKLTGIPILEGYGLTEASPVTHVNLLGGNGRARSIGLPVPSTEAKVVDEAGNEVACGETGELIVRGPQVMKGYWQRPDETAGVLRDGWLWTGDMARRDEAGFFYIVDRRKDMIVVSGFKVFPNEVEAVLAAHPKVFEAAVIGIPDRHAGEAVKAYVVPRDASLTEAELRAYCRTQLTAYKCPREVVFRSELPKSAVGKILRAALKQQEAEVVSA